MALGLDSRCKDTLVDALCKILPKVKVIHNTYLDYKTVVGLAKMDKILPQSGPIYKNLKKYIGDAPLSTFVDEMINRELAETFEYDLKIKGVPLISLTNYNDPKAVALRLIEEFNNLPFNYLISFEFPPPLGEGLREKIEKPFQLSSTMKIILPDGQYDQTYPLNTGKKRIDRELFDSYWVLENLGGRETKKWNQKAVYLLVDVRGFVGKYSLMPPIAEVIATIKSIFGLSIALDFISVKRKHLVRPRVRHLIIHRQINDQWRIFKTQKLPMDFAEVLGNVETSKNNGQKVDGKNTQLNQALLFFLQLVFSSPTERNKRLLKANQWFMDSYMGSNELLAFVQAMIAMEVLLGRKESQKIGIGELLSSRCGYLIGKNHEDRDQVIEIVKDIYDVRSDIVHRGKNTLSTDEKELFYRLRWLSSRIILKEMMLLSKDRQLANPVTKEHTKDGDLT